MDIRPANVVEAGRADFEGLMALAGEVEDWSRREECES
jgi:hypothetical protein